MKASVPAPCRDPASAPTVSFGALFSFWAVSGGVLALRVPAPDPIGQPLACGAGRAFDAHPRIGAPCCGVRLRARGALSFVCGAVPLSPRLSPAAPAPSRCGRPAGALSRRRLTPRTLAVPLWDSRDSRAASGGRSLRRETRPVSLRTLPTSSEQAAACVRPDSLGSGTLSPQDWARSGLPKPPTPGRSLVAQAGAPAGAEPVGGAV